MFDKSVHYYSNIPGIKHIELWPLAFVLNACTIFWPFSNPGVINLTGVHLTIISWEGSNNYANRISIVAVIEQKSYAVIPHKGPWKQPNTQKGFLKIYFVVVVALFCLWRWFAFSLKCEIGVSIYWDASIARWFCESVFSQDTDSLTV